MIYRNEEIKHFRVHWVGKSLWKWDDCLNSILKRLLLAQEKNLKMHQPAELRLCATQNSLSCHASPL